MTTETIRTLLIDGTTRGPQRLSIGNKVCQMFIIPKADLDATTKNFQELDTPCLYILIMGEDRAYIGQSHSFKHRKDDHKKNKDFEAAYVFVDTQISSMTISSSLLILSAATYFIRRKRKILRFLSFAVQRVLTQKVYMMLKTNVLLFSRVVS